MRSHPPTHVPPLALILLLTFCALPAVFYLLSDRKSDLPEDSYTVSDGAAGSPLPDLPMRGMTYGPDGRASLLQAPARILAMDRERDNTLETRSVPVIAGSGRSVLSLPRVVIRRKASDASGIITCDLEEPPVYRGRLILRNGCLRFQPQGDWPEQEFGVATAAPELFRDGSGYLAFGSAAGPATQSIRIGEPDIIMQGRGCSAPERVAAPPAHAALCGEGDLLVIGQVRRRPVCSSAYLERRAATERAEAAADAKVRAISEACQARGDPVCPPPFIPRTPPLMPANAECRLPPDVP